MAGDAKAALNAAQKEYDSDMKAYEYSKKVFADMKKKASDMQKDLDKYEMGALLEQQNQVTTAYKKLVQAKTEYSSSLKN